MGVVTEYCFLLDLTPPPLPRHRATTPLAWQGRAHATPPVSFTAIGSNYIGWVTSVFVHSLVTWHTTLSCAAAGFAIRMQSQASTDQITMVPGLQVCRGSRIRAAHEYSHNSAQLAPTTLEPQARQRIPSPTCMQDRGFAPEKGPSYQVHLQNNTPWPRPHFRKLKKYFWELSTESATNSPTLELVEPPQTNQNGSQRQKTSRKGIYKCAHCWLHIPYRPFFCRPLFCRFGQMRQ